jgi:hypothetical protein
MVPAYWNPRGFETKEECYEDAIKGIEWQIHWRENQVAKHLGEAELLRRQIRELRKKFEKAKSMVRERVGDSSGNLD